MQRTVVEKFVKFNSSLMQRGMHVCSVWTSQIRLKTFDVKGGSNMTGTDLCVNKPDCAAAVRS